MSISQYEDALKEIMDLTMTRYFLSEVSSTVIDSNSKELRPMTFEEKIDYMLSDVEIHIHSSNVSEDALELYARLSHTGKEKLLKMAFKLR